jgi:hypothetical protein
MKKMLVKSLILGALLLSANAAFPLEGAGLDGGPYPLCYPISCPGR